MKTKIFILACLVGLVFSPNVQAAQNMIVSKAPPKACSVTSISTAVSPQWITTGVWVEPDELLLVDALSKDFLRFNGRGVYQGKQSEAVARAVVKKFRDFLPVVAQGDEQDLWVQLVGTRMARIQWGKVTATLDLWGQQVRDDAKLIGIHNWTVSNDQLFGYGLFEMKDESVRAGFFRLNLDAPSDATLIKDFPRDSPVHIWYRLGNQYLASLHGVDYGLWVDDDKMHLVRYDEDAQSLVDVGGLPPELVVPPKLPEFQTTADYEEVMAAVEKKTMPTSLFSWDEHLYLVWRSRDLQGNRDWWLSEIDPEQGKLVSTTRLPSSANHLLLIPGPKEWALIEKGPVVGFGHQATGKVKLIPVDNFRQAREVSRLCQPE